MLSTKGPLPSAANVEGVQFVESQSPFIAVSYAPPQLRLAHGGVENFYSEWRTTPRISMSSLREMLSCALRCISPVNLRSPRRDDTEGITLCCTMSFIGRSRTATACEARYIYFAVTSFTCIRFFSSKIIMVHTAYFLSLTAAPLGSPSAGKNTSGD